LYANIYLSGRPNEYPDKLKLKTEVYPVGKIKEEK